MKNLLFTSVLLLFSNLIFAQYGQGGTINYGKPIDYTTDSKESGKTQTEMQRKYEYNYERYSNAFIQIENNIYSLNVSKEIKDRILERWRKVSNYLKSNPPNFISNSQVTADINLAYQCINKIIYEETNK